MATTTTPMTVEEYLLTSFSPDVDYINGAIEERNVGDNDHSGWQKALVFWFELQAKEGQVRVRPELRVRVAQGQYRIPDVALLDRNLPQERIATHPLVAAFEILSPRDTLAEMTVRCADYERMGVQTIIVIDPEGGAFRFVDGKLKALESNAFEIPGSKCRFDLKEIEKLLD
jgi:Uma2 family endonuclease